jgi:dTDP-4-dehydrorhamnose reductase
MAEDTVAILGGKGMLGTDLAGECTKQGVNFQVFDLPQCDITNEYHLRKAIGDAKAVINCAAYTNVENAESEANLAHQVNGVAVGRLGALARQDNIWVLHISTDFVFDGKSDRPYVETDPPNPINAYGRSKLTGEQLLVESGCRYCIMRLEWTYGLHGSNFINKLLKKAENEKQLTVVDDQVGSPTATTQVAKVICRLLRIKPEGLFHFASAGYVSRFEVAKFFFDKLNIPVDLSSCKTSEYVSAAARPLNSRFDCSKIRALLDEPIEPWQGPLERFLRQL